MAESIEALYGEAYAYVEQGESNTPLGILTFTMFDLPLSFSPPWLIVIIRGESGCCCAGICYDEVGQSDGALAMYEKGLELIDRAAQLSGAASSPLYAKMRDARDHVLARLKDLRASDPAAPSAASATRISPFDAVTGAIAAFGDAKSAEEIFSIPGGCQIFTVQGEETSVPSYPEALRIFRFKEDSPTDEKGPPLPPAGTAAADAPPPAFIQVGDWVHPLVPGRSPVLNTDYGAYIFPSAEAPDVYTALLLPSDLEPGVRGNFENVLKELTACLRSTSVESALSEPENQRLAAKVSRLLVQGGQAVAWGVRKGQELTSGFVKAETDKALLRGSPTDKPRHVDPRVQTSIHYLRRGSKVGVKVSGYLGKGPPSPSPNCSRQLMGCCSEQSGPAGVVYWRAGGFVGAKARG